MRICYFFLRYIDIERVNLYEKRVQVHLSFNICELLLRFVALNPADDRMCLDFGTILFLRAQISIFYFFFEYTN